MTPGWPIGPRPINKGRSPNPSKIDNKEAYSKEKEIERRRDHEGITYTTSRTTIGYSENSKEVRKNKRRKKKKRTY